MKRNMGNTMCSDRGMYIRNTADIMPKWRYIRIADIPELYAIGFGGL
ncbi:MAG: hypothetical protein AEth_00543 [Candidatus Argoarchaeum ethanivorans]|uniref:Uncharacterized protein n=1 Tax=Candidatus Argoarchaeum ethanivorans TaxID=2608793 RepID=A0A8B6SDG1_9EURY|nr:MAG: hypothetical protein AEth_00543 [Candidatus Argoarchaeum ethanivorans]